MHQIPEPLLETTFTLLESVMYSRISRELGGLIFPPSSQPEKIKKREGEEQWQERKRKGAISHCLYMRSSASLFLPDKSKCQCGGMFCNSPNSTASKYTHYCTNICTLTCTNTYLVSQSNIPVSTFRWGVSLLMIFSHDCN